MYLVRCLATVAICCGALLIPQARANDSALLVADGLDTAIEVVATGGLWMMDGDYGRLRVVAVSAGREHSFHRVYLQWLKEDDEQDSTTVFQTVQLDTKVHPSRLVVASITYLDEETDTNECAFEIERLDPRGGPNVSIRLRAGPPGQYSVQED